jgi:N-acetylmuramoyl-L-alanine amidase
MHFKNSGFALFYPWALTLALFFSVILLCPHPSAAAETAVVKGTAVNIRSGPSLDFAAFAQVSQGDRLPVLDKFYDWYHVSLPTGANGWITGQLVNIEQTRPAQSPGSERTIKINADGVNIRSGPGTTYEIVARAGFGQRYSVLERSGDWHQVWLGTSTGWVADWLVAFDPVSSSTPPQAEPPVSSNPPATQPNEQVAVVSGSQVNVRSGPGTTSAVVGQVSKGDNLPVLNQSGDWYQIKLPGGNAGWVAGWLVSLRPTTPSTQGPPPAQQPGSGEVSRGDSRDTNDQTGKVLSMQLQQTNGQTSAMVAADVPFEYNAFTLSGPDRLVVDLKGVAIGELSPSTSVNSKTVKQIRAGHYQREPDVTRLVFELSGGVQYVASLSGDKRNLNVETYIPTIAGSYEGRVVAVDAGHGSPDPGAIGKNGTKEKDVTLDIAKRTVKLLEAKGAKVIMVRSGDAEVGLVERANRANKANADLFVSIHVNAHGDSSIGGTTTYIYSGNGTASEASRIQESNRLARYVQAELLKNLGLRDAGVRSDNFSVLRNTKMPAILAELAFISNVSEEKLINTDNFRNKSAEAIVNGIGYYFSEKRIAYQQ